MRETWLSPNIDFGVPGKIYTISCRQALGDGQGLYLGFKASRSDPTFPAEFAKEVIKTLEKYRPELGPGWILCGIEFQIIPAKWVFWTVHPKLPAVPNDGSASSIERLERCDACHKPLPDTGTYRKINGAGPRRGFESELCSKECFEALPEFIPIQDQKSDVGQLKERIPHKGTPYWEK